MTGETEREVSGWTVDTYRIHNEAMRIVEEKFQVERDRRYAEVKLAEEKALRVKDQADRDALDLQRTTQTYKDEQANNLRSQIERERGSYASKDDLHAMAAKIEETIKPLVAFVQGQHGSNKGTDKTWGYIFAALGAAFGLFGVVVAVAVIFKGATPAQPSTVSTPQIIYVPAPVTEPKGAQK